MIFRTSQFPVVFFDFKTENSETNFSHLLSLCPNAVKISDIDDVNLAYQAVAKLSPDHTHAIIVNSNNFVNENFNLQEVNLIDEIDLQNTVMSFGTKNNINGNIYGSDGVQIFPTSLLANITKYENLTDPNNLKNDSLTFLRFNRMLSELVINTTPKQAWTTGFVEVMKLCYHNDKFLQLEQIDWRNYERLWRWIHIGADIENGIWAILGARQAAYIALTKQNFDYNEIKNSQHLQNLFQTQFDTFQNNAINECNRLGNDIRKVTKDFRIVNVYSSDSSKIYKEIITPCKRSPETFIKYKYPGHFDVVFIGTEKNSDNNFELVKEKYPKVKRIPSNKNIFESYIEAAKVATTEYFWVVNFDHTVANDFNFEFYIPFYDEAKIRIWKSKNPNNVVYDYLGIKLLPKFFTLHMNKDNKSLIENINKPFEPIFNVSNFTSFIGHDSI